MFQSGASVFVRAQRAYFLLENENISVFSPSEAKKQGKTIEEETIFIPNSLTNKKDVNDQEAQLSTLRNMLSKTGANSELVKNATSQVVADFEGWLLVKVQMASCTKSNKITDIGLIAIAILDNSKTDTLCPGGEHFLHGMR